MVLGHYGTALALKAADRKISLGTLFFAVTLSDIILYILLIPGIEKVAVVPGFTRWLSLKTISNDFSHGLLALTAWGLILGAVWLAYYKLIKKEEALRLKSAAILFIAVISHWFCDLLVHVPDLPLLPCLKMKVGLGLWNFPIISNGLEFIIYGAGWILYMKKVPRTNYIFRRKFTICSLFLAAFHLSTGLVSPMESQTFMGASMLFVSLALVYLAARLDRGSGAI